MCASYASQRRAALIAISANTRSRSVGEPEITLRISEVAACCCRDATSSLASSWILRSAEARSSVFESAGSRSGASSAAARENGVQRAPEGRYIGYVHLLVSQVTVT